VPLGGGIADTGLTITPSDSSNRIYAYGINSTNAVIRTHLQFPGGETYGSQVKTEDLTGGTAIRTSRTPTIYPSSLSTGDITPTSTTSISLTTSSLGLNSNSSGVILYRTTVVSNEGKWKGSFSGSTSTNSS